jgi:hypothetical protein
MDRPLAAFARWLALVFLISGGLVQAGPRSETVKADFDSLIRAAALHPDQFAVSVPSAVSASSKGAWSVSKNVATWRYSVRIPTAVSLSFHAINTRLPASARLTVSGKATTSVYDGADIRRGTLLSRIAPGEVLAFTLTVAASEQRLIAFNIDTFQAGYRGLGGGVADHPIYRAIRAAAASSTAACAQNFQCDVTAANTPLGAATVALVVGNLFQCTGTLINSVQGGQSTIRVNRSTLPNGRFRRRKSRDREPSHCVLGRRVAVRFKLALHISTDCGYSDRCSHGC